jgi:hypothetical protein
MGRDPRAGALRTALSRSRVLLVNIAWRFQLEYLFFNALGPSSPSQLARKSPILRQCDNAIATGSATGPARYKPARSPLRLGT